MFCAILGTAAANLVITLGARGGLYIGGGIVPRLGDYFIDSPFRARFEHKGRFSKYLAEVPAWVILAENPALLGLAGALNDGFTAT
jgi:glucokinase